MTTSLTNADLLIIGHGSRDIEAIAEFNQLSKHIQARFPERRCATGFLEFAQPLISDGLHRLIEQGAKHILAIPGMLMAAGHAKNDIPSELNTLQTMHPDITITYGVELGVHAHLLQAAATRIEQAELQLGNNYQRADTLLMVVGRGASDADANANICKITRLLAEGMGFGWSETCFSGVTSPLVPAALETSHRLGFKQIIVFPYFLFTGRLIKQIYADTDAFQANHADIQVVKAGYLNDHPLVIEALIDRMQQVEHGTGNMNCQLCQYRVQLLGAEHRVGQPQQSHHHHVRGIGTDANTHEH